MAITDIGVRLALLQRQAYIAGIGAARKATGDLGDTADKSSRKVDALRTASTRVGSGLKLGITAGAAIGAGAVYGLSRVLSGGIADAQSYQRITTQVGQTIKSTGNAARVSVSGLKDYAGQLESMSGVDEELILSSQNVLLTFTSIRNSVGKNNDIFNQASKAALDLSTTMGGDLQGATVQLGKALNDPVKGVTALSRVGVSFTEQQKAQIKTMAAHNNLLGAQKVVLAEVNKEFGGAAKAAGKGYAGSLARAQDALGDLRRNVMTPFLPVLARGFELLGTKVQAVTPRILGWATRFAATVPRVIGWLGTAASRVRSIIAIARSGSSKGVGEALGLTPERTALVVRAATDIGRSVRGMVNIVRGLLPQVRTLVVAGLALLVTALHIVGPLLDTLGHNMGTVKNVVIGLTAGIVVFRVTMGAMALVTWASRFLQVARAVGTWRAVQLYLNTALTANPIGLVVVAVALLVAGIVIAYRQSDTFRRIVQTAFRVVAQTALWMADKVLFVYEKIAGAAGKLPGPLGAPFRAAEKAIGKVRDKLKGLSQDLDGLGRAHTVPVTVQVRTAGATQQARSAAVSGVGGVLTVGARASGGPVLAHRPYVVGEHEPEVFWPSENGQILNGRQMARLTAPSYATPGGSVAGSDGASAPVLGRSEVHLHMHPGAVVIHEARDGQAAYEQVSQKLEDVLARR